MASSSEQAMTTKVIDLTEIKDEPQDESSAGASYDAAEEFELDHSRIPRAHIDSLPGNIVQEVYDQSVFETGVLAQVEEAAEREQRVSIATKRRLVEEIDEQIRSASGQRLADLTKKQRRLNESIAAMNSVTAVSSVLLNSGNNNVRFGNATPFGTTVKEESKETTSFDNLLAGIGTRRQQVLAKKAKRKEATNQNKKSSDGAASSSAGDREIGSATLHADMDSVSRLLRHKQAPHGNGNDAGRRHKVSPKTKSPSLSFVDDANLSVYLRRLRRWEKKDALFASAEKKHQQEQDDDRNDSDEELSRGTEIIGFDDNMRVPARLWRQLYSYQRTGVRWLWELHLQQVGGILADEMGLGKTVEVCAFLFAVRLSRQRDAGSAVVNVRRYVGLGPVLIVCPATLLRQWAAELHIWAPVFRAVILHSTGSSSDPLTDLLLRTIADSDQAPPVVITSYATLLLLADAMLAIDWHYVILDEGHKIRNPDAQVTSLCKRFSTCHRIVVSGSPMQNNLKELWCLFDFVYPGKLGSQSEFLQHLAIPIVQGGYANATPIQLQCAYKCAVVLRDTISPYMLRRTKADVKNSLTLPNKTEQVLFCRLTEHQENVYTNYLKMASVRKAISGDSNDEQPVVRLPGQKGRPHRLANQGKGSLFAALMRLRHICNHPDLAATGSRGFDAKRCASRWELSAKMVVVASLLEAWHQHGHKVLLFSQTRTMLNILEEFVNGLGYRYCLMDGETPIGQRQNLISIFNDSKSKIFIFLLTTRVGGLGVNLTGADRVIIYDPDWNPVTDTQARERAWRIGQTRDVVIYRLLTSGTIEEKVYHRQIFKQFLTNRVLKDPKQRRFFKVNDIHELFTYTGGQTTAANSKVSSSKFPSLSKSSSSKKEEKIKKSPSSENSTENAAKRRALELAKRLSQKLERAKKNKEEAPSTSKSKQTTASSVVIDGVSVPNAVRVEAAKQQNSAGNDVTKAKPAGSDSEKFVLKRLLKCAGVSDSIDFDSMVSSRPDSSLIDAEASRVAEAAVQALRRSQQQMLSAPRFGTAVRLAGTGKVDQQPLFGNVIKSSPAVAGNAGASSSSANELSSNLVGVLRKRAAESVSSATSLLENEDETVDWNHADEDSNDADVPIPGSVDADTESLLTDLRAFISFQTSQPGQATSGEIVENFSKERKFSDAEFRVFKHLLRRLCIFARRPSDGVGLWTLKSRYR